MSRRHNRSSGGYDLRQQVTKRRWDEDFEYYFSKLEAPVDTNLQLAEVNYTKTRIGDESIFFTSPNKLSALRGLKGSVSQGKRARGRPKKLHIFGLDTNVTVSQESVTGTEMEDNAEIHSKESTCQSSDGRNLCDDQEILPMGLGLRCPVDAILSPEQLTCLQEEEVSCPQATEKDNLSEESVTIPTEDLMDIDEIQKKLVSQKLKRRYRKRKLNEEHDKKLDCLSSDDKIECEECHKLLKPSSFKQHLRTHTGEKPFTCDMCDAKFTRKGDVERHVRIVHNKVKPYKCSKCHRSFGDKKNFRWHLSNHDKKLFYICEVCGFKFGKREYWENHVRIIHPSHVKNYSDEHHSENEETGRLCSLTHTLSTENENSIDDPVEEPSPDCRKRICNGDREQLVKNELVSHVSEVQGANDKNTSHLRSRVSCVDSAVSQVASKSNEQLSDSDVMGTVVIQLHGAETKSEEDCSYSQGGLHMSTSDIIEIVQGDYERQGEQIIRCGETSVGSATQQLVLSPVERSIRTIEYADVVCVGGSQLYGVMIENGQNVQNFVEALLTVAGKDNQTQTAIEAS